MGVPPPVPKGDVPESFRPEGLDDVTGKPESPLPASAPNVPQGPQGHIAAPPAEVASFPPPLQGQSYMTDCQVLERDQGQDGPPHAGQPPAAFGGDQPPNPTAVTDHGNFRTSTFTPQQAMAMSELGMSPSAPNYGPRDDGNQSVGVTGRQTSPSPDPNGSQSPTLSCHSGDSLDVHHKGSASAETYIKGQKARKTGAAIAMGARNLQSARSTSPATRRRIISEKYGGGCSKNIPGCTTSSSCPHDPDMEVSDDEHHSNP